MNLAKVCPDIPDDWRGGVAATCKILGGERPLSPTTLRKYAGLGRRGGGIDWRPSGKGKMIFSGKEIKRFWNAFPH